MIKNKSYLNLCNVFVGLCRLETAHLPTVGHCSKTPGRVLARTMCLAQDHEQRATGPTFRCHQLHRWAMRGISMGQSSSRLSGGFGLSQQKGATLWELKNCSYIFIYFHMSLWEMEMEPDRWMDR